MSHPTAPVQYRLGLDQRWRGRRTRFVPPGVVFDPSRHGVEPIGRGAATAFVAEHHYLATTPVAVACHGLFERAGVGPSRLVGVAVFGMAASPHAFPSRAGLPEAAGLELTRFVLLDDVAFNGESFFIARALRALAASRPGLRVVLAHSDPTPRATSDGTVVAGHVGQVYAAANAIYAGRGQPRVSLVARDGRVVPDRLLSKVRRDGVGAAGGERRLVGLGAPERHPHEDRRAWLARALASGAFARSSRKGVHAFLLPLDVATRRAIEARHDAPRPTRPDGPATGVEGMTGGGA